MAPVSRAIWKGGLELGRLLVPVAIFAAVSTAHRIKFAMLNRATGNRLRRGYFDPKPGREVPKRGVAGGIEIEPGKYEIPDLRQVEVALRNLHKKLVIEKFVRREEVDQSFLDRPYFLTPSGLNAATGFAVVRDAMAKKGCVGLARGMLRGRYVVLLLEPDNRGIIAHRLHFDYEVRSAEEAFETIPEPQVNLEMLDFAKRIIAAKITTFDPETIFNRYDAALVQLVQSKIAKYKNANAKARMEPDSRDLLDALGARVEMNAEDRLDRRRAGPHHQTRHSTAGGEADVQKESLVSRKVGVFQ